MGIARKAVFRHVLLPTDGSRLAAKGVKAGVKLARALGARVTGIYVRPERPPPIYGEAALYYMQGDYEKLAEKAAGDALAAIAREARAAGVACAMRILKAAHPWQGILAAARASRCDVIVMASHGRSGIGGAILGSETQHVLAHARMPVVVIR